MSYWKITKRYRILGIAEEIGVMEMKIKCPNCGKEFDLYRLKHDENNLEGFYTYHSKCRASFDIDFDMFLLSF